MNHQNHKCCCNCKFQRSLRKHPWNKTEALKGAISKDTGLYACIPPLALFDAAVVFEGQHGLCEFHEDKGSNNQNNKNEENI